jgi:hypothetical protein
MRSVLGLCVVLLWWSLVAAYRPVIMMHGFALNNVRMDCVRGCTLSLVTCRRLAASTTGTRFERGSSRSEQRLSSIVAPTAQQRHST